MTHIRPKVDMQRVNECADQLQGTSQNEENILTADEIDCVDFRSALDQQIFRCASCDWWGESSEECADCAEQNPHDQTCSDCCPGH